MEKKQFVGKWAERIAVFLPLFLSGCVTLNKSQENFAKQMQDSEESIARAASVASLHTFIIYLIWAIGMLASAVGGHYIVSPYVKSIKRYLNVKTNVSTAGFMAGCIERIIYTFSFVLGWYSVIVILFVLKIGQIVVKYLDIDTKKAGNVANAYMLGNLLSLGSALLAGIIIKQLLLRV